MPWSSWTTWSPTFRSRNAGRRRPTTGPRCRRAAAAAEHPLLGHDRQAELARDHPGAHRHDAHPDRARLGHLAGLQLDRRAGAPSARPRAPCRPGGRTSRPRACPTRAEARQLGLRLRRRRGGEPRLGRVERRPARPRAGGRQVERREPRERRLDLRGVGDRTGGGLVLEALEGLGESGRVLGRRQAHHDVAGQARARPAGRPSPPRSRRPARPPGA